MAININTASTHLSRLLKSANVNDKGTQMVDALTDEGKKIKLKGPEVDNLLAHVDGLPDARAAGETEKQVPLTKGEALDLLSFFRDRFELVDAGVAAKKFIDAVPTKLAPFKPTAPVRTVAEEAAKRATATPIAKPKELAEIAAAVDNIAKNGGPDLAADAAAHINDTVASGDVKVDPEARKDYVKSTAKHGNPMLRRLEDYKRSPFFEDRLMAFMMGNAMTFQKQMDSATNQFDDPKRLEAIKEAFNDAAKKMTGMADQLSPDGKLRVAAHLSAFLKENPDLSKELPAYQEWATKFKDAAAPPPNATAAQALDAMPPADGAILSAMKGSTNKAVREFAAVFQAAGQAEEFKKLTPDVVSNMGEEDLRKVHGNMKEFATGLRAMREMLPDDVRKSLPPIEVSDLPAQIDPTSRQVMFQQINMMMQQYQQIMQALNEVMNKLNEMAMEPIRRIGR